MGQGARLLILATAALLALLALGWTEARARHDRNFWMTLGYLPVRAQLNALNALAADLDMESAPSPAGAIRTGLRSLRAEAQ